MQSFYLDGLGDDYDEHDDERGLQRLLTNYPAI